MLANEVLDGIVTHKKYIGILATKAQIAQRKKAHAEGLEVLAAMEK